MGDEGVRLKDRLLQAKVKGCKKQSCMWAVEGAWGSKRCSRWVFYNYRLGEARVKMTANSSPPCLGCAFVTYFS